MQEATAKFPCWSLDKQIEALFADKWAYVGTGVQGTIAVQVWGKPGQLKILGISEDLNTCQLIHIKEFQAAVERVS